MSRWLVIQTNEMGRPCGWGVAVTKEEATAEADRQYDEHAEKSPCYPGEKRGSVLVHELPESAEPPVPRPREVIIVGPDAWGKGDTFEEAKKNYRKEGGKLARYLVYDVPNGTRVDGMGDFTYDHEHRENPPVLLKKVVGGKEVKEK